MKTGHPLLLLNGGSVCPKSELQASTAIQFVCDTSVFAAGTYTNSFLLSTHASLILSYLRQTRINSAVTRRRGHRLFVLHRVAHTCEYPTSSRSNTPLIPPSAVCMSPRRTRLLVNRPRNHLLSLPSPRHALHSVHDPLQPLCPPPPWFRPDPSSPAPINTCVLGFWEVFIIFVEEVGIGRE